MSNNPNLKELGVQQTTLFFLDVKNNPNLEILHVGNNPLLGFEIPDGAALSLSCIIIFCGQLQ